MNLLFTSTAYPPSIGGAQSYTQRLVQYLAKSHHIEVVSHWDENRTDWLLGTTLKAPGLPRDYVLDGVQVHRLGFPKSEKMKMLPFVAAYYIVMNLALPILAHNIEKHLLKYSSGIDLVHNVRIGREPISFASYELALEKNIPFVFTPLHHPRWSGWIYRQYHNLYRRADDLIVLSAAESKILTGFGVDEKKIFVTGIGPVLANQSDDKGFRQRFLLGDDPIILFLGQKYAYKGIEALLKSAPLVWKRFPETRLVFMGPPTDFSRRLFAEMQDSRILEIGNVDLQTKTDALAACSMLCVPSTQESFGGVYTEAWSFGKPVVGCPIPAVAEVICDGEDGLLTAQEPKAIAQHLISLLSDPSLAQRLGISGKKKVDTRYNWPILAQKTEEIYIKALYG